MRCIIWGALLNIPSPPITPSPKLRLGEGEQQSGRLELTPLPL